MSYKISKPLWSHARGFPWQELQKHNYTPVECESRCFCIQEVNHILTKSVLLEHEHVFSLTFHSPRATQVIGKDTEQSDFIF